MYVGMMFSIRLALFIAQQSMSDEEQKRRRARDHLLLSEIAGLGRAASPVRIPKRVSKNP